MLHFNLKLSALCVASLVACTGIVPAQSITGNELVTACEKAIASEFTGNTGMICHWYVTPCDCNYGNELLSRVCLPAEYNEEKLAQQVIDGLNSNPDLLSKEAAFAANSVLTTLYPCTD